MDYIDFIYYILEYNNFWNNTNNYIWKSCNIKMIENNSEIKILDLLFSYIIMDLPIRIYLEEINPIEMKCQLSPGISNICI